MDIESLEKIFDERFASVKLPSNNKDKAKWLLLTFSEDFLLINWGVTKSLHHISVMANSQKYSIKFALARIEAELTDAPVDLQVIITGGEYNGAKALLDAGEEFTNAHRICMLVHAGLYSYHYENSIFELADTRYWGAAGYSCLLYTSPSPRDRTRSRMPSSA